MADNHVISCVLGIMDQLWFQQVILFPKILQQSSMAASSEQLFSNNSSAHSSETQVISEENSSIISNQSDGHYYSNEQDSDEKERPKRLKPSGSETRCHSSSPSRRKRRSDVYRVARRRLSKTVSCKSLCELELEEVQGFVDLGFTFDNEHLNKRMMSVIPGLQRLDLGRSRNNNDHQTRESNEEEEEEEGDGAQEEEGERKLERGGVIRPYLSEAWLVKRTDSPLLNLRIPSVSTADDMKKHLKYWAKTVASAIQLESC